MRGIWIDAYVWSHERTNSADVDIDHLRIKVAKNLT